MRRPLLRGKRRDYYDALCAEAAMYVNPTLEGKERRQAMRRETLEIEIERLGQPAYVLPRPRRLDVLVRAIIYGVLATPFAWGLYDLVLETHRSLLEASMTYALIGVVICCLALILLMKVGPGRRRLVRPMFVLAAITFVLAGWLFWQHLRHPLLDTTGLWHYFVSDPLVRHGDRKTGEGIVIAIVGLSVSYNAYSLGRMLALQRGPHWWDILEYHARVPNRHDDEYRRRLGLPQLSAWQIAATWGFWQFLYAGWAALLLLHLAARLLHLSIPETGPEWVRLLEDPATGSVIYLVIGLLVAPLARRPDIPVLEELEKWRAQAFVKRHGNRIRWYHHLLLSPYYIELIRRTNDLDGDEVRRLLRERSNWVKAGIVLGILIFLAVWARGAWQELTVYGVLH